MAGSALNRTHRIGALQNAMPRETLIYQSQPSSLTQLRPL